MQTKTFVLSQLEIDSDNGKICLKAPNEVLTILNLDFKNVLDKFTSIYIEGNQVTMYEEGNNEKPEEELIIDIFEYLHIQMESNPKIVSKESFLKLLMLDIKKFMKNY